MSGFTIGIIGGTGGIGKWFARFFQKKGHTVHVSDEHSGMPLSEMAALCEVVIVSVPIGVTCDVIRAIGPHMKETSLLMDFTSLKEEPVKAMMEFSHSEILGCHPLFGPAVSGLSGHRIVLCPARLEKWRDWPKGLFLQEGARIVEASPSRHDRLMTLIQGLNHLNTITMGLTMRNTGFSFSELEDFSTPLFDSRRKTVEKILGGNLRLYAEIITHNPDMPGIFDLYERNLKELRKFVENKDAEGLAAFINNET